MKSPFFFLPDGRPVVEPPKVVEKLVYDGGHFAKLSQGEDTYWLEYKSDGSAQYRFIEKRRDDNWIILFDGGRNMTLRLPVGPGVCSWSTDGGQTWHPLYRVTRAKP